MIIIKLFLHNRQILQMTIDQSLKVSKKLQSLRQLQIYGRRSGTITMRNGEEVAINLTGTSGKYALEERYIAGTGWVTGVVVSVG